MPRAETTPGMPIVFVRSVPTMAGAAGLGVPTGPTVAWMIDEFLAAVDDGTARDRYGRRFTSDAARGLHWHLRGYLRHACGDGRLRQLDRADIEGLLLELRAAGLSTEQLRALAKSVRALYDHAMERQLVDANAAERLAVPDDREAEQPTLRRGGPRLDRRDQLARVVALACLLLAIVLLGAQL